MGRKLKSIYLVDCENVGSNHLDILSDTSLVYYFTSNSRHIDNLKDYEKEVYCEHECIRDYLDFIIDGKLGFLIRHYGKEVNYIIVSKDKGFDGVRNHWVSSGYKVYRYQYICEVVGMFFTNYKDYLKVDTTYNNWLSSLNKTQSSLVINLSKHKYSCRVNIENLCNSLYNYTMRKEGVVVK